MRISKSGVSKAFSASQKKKSPAQTKVRRNPVKSPKIAAIIATGRRKSAIAQVQLSEVQSGDLSSPTTAKIIINGKDYITYMQQNLVAIDNIQQPFDALGFEKNYEKNYNVLIKTSGGGLIGQAEAIKLGLARALCQIDKRNRSSLKTEGYLTRNSLKKERKKYGLKKARKAPQFSKR